MIQTLAHKIATARRMPLLDVALAATAWVMLGVASLLIATLPSHRILRSLGRNLGPTAQAPAIGTCQRHRAARIARAVAVASRYAPFRADCLPQALVAAQLCRWLAVPHALHLGARVARPGTRRVGRLEAHAWIRSDAFTLCGGADSAQRFGTVASFVHVPRSRGRHTGA